MQAFSVAVVKQGQVSMKYFVDVEKNLDKEALYIGL